MVSGSSLSCVRLVHELPNLYSTGACMFNCRIERNFIIYAMPIVFASGDLVADAGEPLWSTNCIGGDLLFAEGNCRWGSSLRRRELLFALHLNRHTACNEFLDVSSVLESLPLHLLEEFPLDAHEMCTDGKVALTAKNILYE